MSSSLCGILSFFHWYSLLWSLHSTSVAACLLQDALHTLSLVIKSGSGFCSAGDGCSTRKEQFWKRGREGWMWMCLSCRCLGGLAWHAGFYQRENPRMFSLSKNELKQAVLLTNTDILTFGWDADSTSCYCALTCLSHDITNQKYVG